MAISVSLPQPSGVAPTYHQLTAITATFSPALSCNVAYTSYMDATRAAGGMANAVACKETQGSFSLSAGALLSYSGGGQSTLESLIDAAVIGFPGSPLSAGTVVASAAAMAQVVSK